MSTPPAPSARRARAATLALWLASVSTGALLVEALCRRPPFDLYAAELRRANPASELLAAAGRPTLLVMGDSFSADPEGFSARLRQRLAPGTRVIASGVSGFTSRQVARLLPRRLRRFAPRVVLFQLYAGNDLLELRHKLDWRRASPPRNLLWWLSDHGFEAPGVLNYKAGQLVAAWRRPRRPPPDVHALEARPFEPSLYTPRERVLLAADPEGVDKQVRVVGEAAVAFDAYTRDLSRALALARAAGARPVLLVIPHAVQVHPRYRRAFERLGARFAPSDERDVFLERVQAWAERENAPVIAPIGALRAAEATGRGVYRPNDPHLSRAGQRLVGDVTAEALATQLGAR